MSSNVDAVIIGAGAAGLMCALTAAQRGRKIVLLDHSAKLAEKIRISGGGRCNFTNLDVKPEHFISSNPDFCRSALARYTPRHFTDMLDLHGIAYQEKTLGQLFCDEGSEAIITLLRNQCEEAGVRRMMNCEIESVASCKGGEAGFNIKTARGAYTAKSLVVATGGLSIPKTGATPFGYHIAEQFGIPISKLKPGLVPLSVVPDDWKPYAELTGVSLDVSVSVGKQSFRENMLVTHRGLSGPAILQISSYWQHGQVLHINLLPELDMEAVLTEHHTNQKLMSNFLTQWMPKNFADAWCEQNIDNKPIKQYNEKQRKAIAEKLHDWQVTPSGTLGYTKAEVTCGGVDTRALSSKTMECNTVPGLYFIGEVLDVTGQLGGYNFQWAWASGHAAGEAI
ncbi:MAG: NAD(P)/FAD-dependent oxidoreductase [Gallionella sp.]|nr:NAD(P)/FAD-dependent oxidoreductase [Gallionella sp.]